MKKASSKILPDAPKDGSNTFTLDELKSLSILGHRQLLTERYLTKVAQRPDNPRLDYTGAEILNPHSLVAEIDMQPLSMKQNISRFVRPNDALELPEYDESNDHDFDAPDRSDNPPTPHELRAKKLSHKLTAHREAARKAADEAKEKAATPLPEDTKSPTPTKPPAKSEA